MTKKTRSLILLGCAAVFFIITPYIVLYSLGYRVDFTHAKIVATGGMYVRALPQGVTIAIDSKSSTTGLFSSSFFVQNLLPGPHSVSITKDGYFDYHKNLPVQGQAVTKLEHVVLFKKNILFEPVPGITPITQKHQLPTPTPAPEAAYLIKNGNLYYSKTVTPITSSATPKSVPMLKNILTYTVSNSRIIWLGFDGLLYSSDLNGANTSPASLVPAPLGKSFTYKLFAFGPYVFLKENFALLLLDNDTKTWQPFYNPVTGALASPDGQKLLIYNDHEILLATTTNITAKIFLNRFSGRISNVSWLGSDYIMFSLPTALVISEIDARDAVNVVSFGPELSLTDGTKLAILNPQLYVNQDEKKLYLLQAASPDSPEKTLYNSEKLLP